MVTLNFSKVNSPKNYTPLKPGIYTVEIVNAEEKISTNAKECWQVTFKIIEDNVYEGKKINNWFYFTEKALPRFKLFCEALGEYDVEADEDVTIYPEDLLEKKLKIRIEIEGRKINVAFDGFYKYEETNFEEEDLPF